MECSEIGIAGETCADFISPIRATLTLTDVDVAPNSPQVIQRAAHQPFRAVRLQSHATKPALPARWDAAGAPGPSLFESRFAAASG